MVLLNATDGHRLARYWIKVFLRHQMAVTQMGSCKNGHGQSGDLHFPLATPDRSNASILLVSMNPMKTDLNDFLLLLETCCAPPTA